MEHLFKKITFAFIMLVSFESLGQQWSGSSSISGNIYRNGNVSIGTSTAGARMRIDMDENGSTVQGLWIERNNDIYVDTHGRINISSNGGIPGLIMSVSSNNGASFQQGIFITENTNVGIGTGTPSQKLHVFGNVLANAYLTPSDKRFKQNIRGIESENSKLLSLRGVSYEMNKESFKDYEFNDKKHIGLIAQEVREVYPEIVYEDDNGYLSVDYISLIPIMIEVMKKQEQKINQQQSEISKLLNAQSSQEVNVQNEISAASLEQNSPNPFNQTTLIKYFIPRNAVTAQILIYDMNGKQIQNHKVSKRGNESLTLTSGELEAGLYIYTLIVDGEEISSKRLILTKE